MHHNGVLGVIGIRIIIFPGIPPSSPWRWWLIRLRDRWIGAHALLFGPMMIVLAFRFRNCQAI
jgi:hypothetical protein